MYTLFHVSPPHPPLAAISSSLGGRNRGISGIVLKEKEENAQVAGAAIFFLGFVPSDDKTSLIGRLCTFWAITHDPLAQGIPFSSLPRAYVTNSCSIRQLHTASFCVVVLRTTHNRFREILWRRVEPVTFLTFYSRSTQVTPTSLVIFLCHQNQLQLTFTLQLYPGHSVLPTPRASRPLFIALHLGSTC